MGISLLLLAYQPAQAQLNDPTRPPNISDVVSETATGTTWDLSSILVSPERSVAIINGKTVQTGETLSGASILNINETGVKLKYRGEVILLKLFPGSVKTEHDAQK